jgi:TfoX/Sxy family transcriptional regulator of competence genes
MVSQRADAYRGRVAYDEALAERVRSALAGEEGVAERKMFGGIAFMVGGNMALGVRDEELMVRLGDIEDALAQPHTRQSMMGERPMKGIVLVSQDADLGPWIARGVDHARSLPPK